MRDKVEVEYIDSFLEFCGDKREKQLERVIMLRENIYIYIEIWIEYMCMFMREKGVFEDVKEKIILIYKFF